MEKPQVLVFDDDPSHLKLYSWILDASGFSPVPVLVSTSDLEVPPLDKASAAVVDYRLGPHWSCAQLVGRLRGEKQQLPVIILSDSQWVPEDVKSLASAFVPKGDPQALVDCVRDITR